MERRLKEVGIRKVLGASVPALVLLLTREFVLLVALEAGLLSQESFELTRARVRHMAELHAAHTQLTDLDRLKTRFINTAAHELNTPLTPIRIQLHLLQRASGLAPEHRKAVQILDRNVDRLSRLVADVLDAAREAVARGLLTRYSFRNVVLILAQRPDAVDVAGFAALLLQRGREMGLVPQLEGTAAWIAEILSILPDLSPYPRALVLLDVNADALPDGGHRLSGIQAGLILLTGTTGSTGTPTDSSTTRPEDTTTTGVDSTATSTESTTTGDTDTTTGGATTGTNQ